MKILANLIVLFLLFENTAYIAQISKDVKKLADSAVWDIDKARDSFMHSAQSMYQQGCFQGTEWQAAVEQLSKASAADYNVNNEARYCTEHWELWPRDTALQELNTLGRKRWGEPE